MDTAVSKKTVTLQIFISCFRFPKEVVVVLFLGICPTCENTASNNYNRCVWSDEETKVFLDLIHEKDILTVLDGKQQRKASMFCFL